jgi:phenylalanyl-tRNA synthetase alpha subunit
MKRSLLLVIVILFIFFTAFSAIRLVRISHEKKISSTSFQSSAEKVDRAKQSYSGILKRYTDRKKTLEEVEIKYIAAEQHANSLLQQYSLSNRPSRIARISSEAERLKRDLKDELDLSVRNVEQDEKAALSQAQEVNKAEEEKRNFELELKKIEGENKKAFQTLLVSLLGSLIASGTTIAVAIINRKT